MTRRSPTTWPAHLTPGQLMLAVEAATAQANAAETPAELRQWRRLSNYLARELASLRELPEVRAVLRRRGR